MIYKLSSKVLANGLKKMLSTIIFQSQSAFILWTLITNNVIIVYEALHTMATRQSGKKGIMALKLDMSKACDRIKWNFLEAIMIKMGSGEK